LTLPHLRSALLALALALGLCWLAAPASAAPAGQAGQDTPTPGPNDGRQYGLSVAVAPAYGGVYRPGSWLPVTVDLANSGTDRTVEVRVGPRQGAQYAAEVELPNGARKSVTVYVYIPGAQRRLTARILDDGAELASQGVDLRPTATRARVVGLLTATPFQPPARLPDGISLAAIPLAPAELPEHPLGLSTFDTILLDDAPTVDLSDSQRSALEDWVLRGGQLLLGGGPGLERTLAGLPTPMHIAELAGVDSFPAAALLGADGEGTPDIPVARLTPLPDAGGRQPYGAPTAGLAADGRFMLLEQGYGRGALSVFAAPLSHPALLGWPGRDRLWADMLRAPASTATGFVPDGVSPDMFVESNLASALTGLPALEFPSLLAIGGLIAAYILVVGPGVYLLLRRLDRQALGWVVVPLVTVAFAAAAYGLGYAQRGGDVLVNQITFVEDLGSSGHARLRSFAGLFSPSRTRYVLDVAGAPDASAPMLLRPVAVQGFDGGAGSGVFVQEGAGDSQARDLEVAQWSMRAVASDSLGGPTGVQARVSLQGENLLAEVTNNGSERLLDVAVVQGDRVVRLGDIAPGETRSGELKRRAAGPGGGFGTGAPLSYLIYGDEIDRNSKNGGQPLPPDLQQRQRLLDALFAYGPAPRDGQPTLFAWSEGYATAVSPVDRKAEHEHTALIVAQPRIAVEGGAVDLPRGWLSIRMEGPQSGVCYGSQGSGVTLGPDPVVVQLSLPRDLYGLRADELTLLTGADNAWPQDTSVELYDWASGQWVAQPAAGKPLAVADAERFLGSHGRLRVRLASTLAQPSFGCIYVDATLKGSLQ